MEDLVASGAGGSRLAPVPDQRAGPESWTSVLFAVWSLQPLGSKVLLSECRFALELGCWCRAGYRVPLQGAAVRVMFALWCLVDGAAESCRCRVQL